MSTTHTLLRSLRQIHLYTGVFIAPALLFFAFTGALQTFSLHETTLGSNYKPPAWAVVLAQLHKKQTPVIPSRKAPSPPKPAENAAAAKAIPDKAIPDKAAQDKPQSPPAAKPPAPTAPTDYAAPQPHNSVPLKLFFLVVSIGLFTSTLSGLYMSYKSIRNKRPITAMLVAGVIVPILFTML